MRRSNKILLIVGVLLAAVSFVAVLAFGVGQQPQAAADPETAVVVAAQDISLGTAVTAEMLSTVQLPESQATDTFDSPDTVVGQVVRRAVTQGEALTNEDFQSGVSVPELVSAIAPGMRAIAVPLSRVDSVGMLLQPGDYVDVVMTMSDLDGLNPVVTPNTQAPTGVGGNPAPYLSLDEFVNNTTVKVVVQNVQVLAAIPKDPPEASDGSQPADTQPDVIAILAVQPQQVEVIRFAQRDGNVSVVLRSPGDYAAGEVTTTGITLSELVERWGVLPPAPVAPPTAP